MLLSFSHLTIISHSIIAFFSLSFKMKLFFLLFFLLKLEVSSVPITNINNDDYIRHLINNTTSILEKSNMTLTNLYKSPIMTSNFYRACKNNVGFGKYNSHLTPDIDFNNVPINRSNIIFKQFKSIAQNTSDDIYRINGMESAWNFNLASYPNELAWQYVATSNIYGIFPNFNWSHVNECPGSYSPEFRPWFVSATTGQKNLVLLIDTTSGVNSTDRLNAEILFVNTILDTLSSYDYVNIVRYSSFPVMFTNSLIQATYENIILLKQWVNTTTLSNFTTANVGTTIKAVKQMLSRSIEHGYSSQCHSLILFASSGVKNYIKLY